MPQYTRTSVYERQADASADAAANPGPEGAYPAAGTRSPSLQHQVERWLDLLSRRKWIVIAVFVLAAGWGINSSMNRVPVYQANSFVLVDLGRMSAISAQANSPLSAESMGAPMGQRSIATELFIIRNSRMIEDRVEQRLRQMKMQDGVGVLLRGAVNFNSAGRDVPNAILVQASSPDPQEAALLANLYAEEYVSQTQDVSRSSLSASRAFLEKQEQERRQELRSIEDQLESYKRNNASIGLTAGEGSVVGRIAALEAERDAASIELQMRQASLGVVEQELDVITPNLAKRVASDVDQRLGAAQQKKALLEADRTQAKLRDPRLTDSSPAVASLTQQIDQLDEEIQTLSHQYVEEVTAAGGIPSNGVDGGGLAYVADLRRQATQDRIEINGLKAKTDVVRNRIAEQQSELNQLPEQQLTLARLERSRAYADQMYQFIVRRLQEVQISEESEPGYARILRPAAVPAVPEGPDGATDMAKNILLGLLLGIGLAVLRDKLDNRFHKPEELRDKGFKVISVIPDMGVMTKGKRGKNDYAEIGDRRISSSFISVLFPMSAIAEAYRSLRTSIQFSRPDAIVQTILVTSSAQEEGKSTTASNLAIVMAQSGRRTLLIDCDLHRPRLNKLFDSALEPGLVQLLFDETRFQADSYSTLIDNLFMVPAGGCVTELNAAANYSAESKSGTATPVLNPSELLGSKRMRNLLASLREEFDIIILDAPPTLAVTDAALISTQADGTLVVVRAGVTKEGDLAETMNILSDVGARIMGTVLNGFDVSRSYGYAYRYRYQRYAKYSGYAYYNTPATTGGRVKRWWNGRFNKTAA